jgi:hypothetical protein
MQKVFCMGTQARAMTQVEDVPSACGQGSVACGHQQTGSGNGRKGWGWGGEVVGDGRVGRVEELSRETRWDRNGVHGRWRPEEPPGGSQSVRSSEEAGNDRGAKGRREVEA